MMGMALRPTIGLLGAAAALVFTSVATAASAPGPAWQISLAAQPTNLPPTSHGNGEPADRYIVVLSNVGSVASNGTVVTVTDTFPEGVGLGGAAGGPGWECNQSLPVTCRYIDSVAALGQSSMLAIPVTVEASGTLVSHVTVSGGGAPMATADLSTVASPNTAPFGFLPSFSSQLYDEGGAPDVGAGDHPYALATTIELPVKQVADSVEGKVQEPKAVEFELPAGLSANPQVAPRCPIVDVVPQRCPPSSRVGTLLLDHGNGFGEGGESPIYNVVPEHGYPAELAVYLFAVHNMALMYGSLGAPPEYRLHVSVPNVPYDTELTSAIITFFGNPESVDDDGNSPVAFFTNPSDCSGVPLETQIEANSWEEPEHWVHAEAQAPPVSGCNRLRFQPAIEVTPSTIVAGEPTGYTVGLEVPQSQSTGLEGLATPDVKNATVTFPVGVSLSPGSADGLAGCPAEGPEGINLTSNEAGNCPLASQVGTAEAVTPLLSEPLKGHVYVALPGCGGGGQPVCTDADAVNGTLFGLYLELEGSGIVIKQHGTASANPNTGQLTASFRNAPQQPFSDLKLTLKDGPRAPFTNPQTCGAALTTSDITPWSSPQTPDATPSWEFPVTGCGGSPFTPTFEAGTTQTAAGAYTDFTTTFGRSDRQQDLSSIQLQTPPGLLGMLSHVTLCEEPQAAAGTCSSASEIGTATVGVGAGSSPFWASGPVYLTGPYKGAPFGLSVAVPAKAGPFNLGTVVTRATLNVNPETSALTITSDPLPQILDGVPLRVQTVNVTVKRSQFIFNPTNCAAQQVTATILSAQGTAAHVASPFAAGGCENLPFDPGFAVSTRAPGSKKNGTSFDVKVSSVFGQASIHSVAVTLPKQLPARLTTIQKACLAATFEANPAACPAASLVGIVKAISPVLPVPLTGPAYLVSHGGAAFPNLEVILQGEGVRIDLKGSIDIKHDVTSSTFANIPDAPISSFELSLPAGPHSALTTTGNLCTKGLVMPTTLLGANGRRLVRSVKIGVAGCPKAKPRRKAKKK